MKDEVKNINDKFTKDLKDGWVTINRKENKEKRWLKLTQAYPLEGGCLIKTSTEFRNVNWDIIACSESTAFIPNGKVLWVETETDEIEYTVVVSLDDMNKTEVKTIQKLLGNIDELNEQEKKIRDTVKEIENKTIKSKD